MNHQQNIIILYSPNIFQNNDEIVESKDVKEIINVLSNFGQLHNYFFPYHYTNADLTLDDYSFNTIAVNIYEKFIHINSAIIVCLEHASPYGLYYADKYPQKCKSIICYPLRLYSQKSLERRMWKYKDRGGWTKYLGGKYDIDEYYVNITNNRLKELVVKPQDIEKQILYLIFDYQLMKQHNNIPKVYKIPTYIYSRLDADIKTIVELNYDRKEIADMKGIVSENDALYNSMMWNFARIKHDKEIMDKNNNDNLLIQYYIGGIENIQLLVNNIKAIIYSKKTKSNKPQ